MTDPIADMLTRIRNASAVRKSELVLDYSKHKMALATILAEEGYVEKVEHLTNGPLPAIRIVLKYENAKPFIRSIRRISAPGRRVYVSYRDLPHVLQDLGIAIVSTPRGLMTNKRARKERLGGELLCELF